MKARSLGNIADQKLEIYRQLAKQEKLAAYLLFAKDICDFTPRVHQLYYADTILAKTNVVGIAPPRAGKTMLFQNVDLFDMVMNKNEDYRIYGPSQNVCKETFTYCYDWIDKSPVSTAFLRRKAGKPELTKLGCEFINGSNAKCYSINSQIEGHNATIMRMEEFDEWQWSQYGDVLRRGGATNNNGLDTRIRVTGVIRGKDNLYKLNNDPDFKDFTSTLMHPVYGRLDVNFMIKAGALDAKFVEQQRKGMSEDEFKRSMLCLFTSNSSFFSNASILYMLKKSLSYGLEFAQYEPGKTYDKIGKVALGFDCGHSGTKKSSSKFVATFFEQVGKFKRLIYAKEWPATTSDKDLMADLLALCEFFRPDGGFGDSLKSMFIQQFNRKLYLKGLTSINPDNFPENSPSSWKKWFIQPIHNDSRTKHLMYTGLQIDIEQGHLFLPYYSAKDKSLEAITQRKIISQMDSIRKIQTKTAYPSYKSNAKRIGDDYIDAGGMGNLWLLSNPTGKTNYNIMGSAGSASVSSYIPLELA